MKNQTSYKNYFLLTLIPIPFLFYWYTCLPSMGLGDSAVYLDAIKSLKFSPYVNRHNLTTLVGWPFQFLPVGDFAYRGNLSCVFTGGLAICTFFTCIYLVQRCWLTAFISSVFLMVSQSMWWHSTTLADYAMNAFLTTLAIYLFVQLQQKNQLKYLYALFFLSGLVLFQHYLMGTLLIGTTAALIVRLFQRKETPQSLIWTSAIFFLLGLIPWLISFCHYAYIKHSLPQAVSASFGGPFKKLFFKYPLGKGLIDYLFLVFMEFPSFYLLPIALGLFFFLKRWKLSESSVGLIFTFLPVFYFELSMRTWAKFAQLISTFIILAFWSSFVVHWIIHHPKVKQSIFWRWFLTMVMIVSLGWTIYFYAHLTQWAQNPKSRWLNQYSNNYYSNCGRFNEFLANPNKRNFHDIEEFCHLLLTKLPPHAEFWDSESRFYYQLKLYYQRYEHQRPDILFQWFNSFGFPNIGANKETFNQKIKEAYLNGGNFFLCSLDHPYVFLLANVPEKQNYQFEKFYLNDQWWVYKLKPSSTKQNK